MRKSRGVRLSSRSAAIFAAIALPVAAALFLAPAPRVFAGDCCGGDEDAKKDESKAQGLLVDLGNAKCPVMGGDVDGKSYTEWNGLRVGHCCPGCSKKLLAYPEKVLADSKIEWKAAADAVKAVDAAKGADRAKALDALKKKWKVLREPAPESPAK